MTSIPVLDPFGENSHPDPFDERVGHGHPDLAALDAVNGRRFGICADWVTAQVAEGWPLDVALAEAARRIGAIQDRTAGGR